MRRRLQSLPKGTRLRVVGHSQGAAKVSAGLSLLTAAERSRIDVQSIGGAACTFPGGLHGIEIDMNSRDIVPMDFGAHPRPCRDRLAAQSREGTKVSVRYYSFGVPMVFSSSHALRQYVKVMRVTPASDSAVESEIKFWFVKGFNLATEAIADPRVNAVLRSVW